MATSHKDAMLPSAVTLACAIYHHVSLLQMLLPSDVNQALVASCPLGAKPTTLINMHDTLFASSSTASSSSGDWNDVIKYHGGPTFGVARLKAGFARLCQLVTLLFVQVTVIASDVISLKDRLTAVEGTQTPALVHGQEAEALTRQVGELCKRVASQEDRIANLELAQRTETDSYKKTIEELTAKIDNTRVDDDNTLENLCQSFKNFQQSMECQAARITGVKADTARKIALLQSEVIGVQAELAMVKTVAVAVNASPASQIAKEVQALTLASVAQPIEDAKDALCPLPVVARSSACATAFQDTPAVSTSSSGLSITITLPNYRNAADATAKSLEILKEPFSTAHANVVQPGVERIHATSIIPIPTKGDGKENKPCNGSTMTPQPGTGWSLDVRDKPPTASPKKAQLGAGLPLKISALPRPCKSMLPAPRESYTPGLPRHVIVVNGSSSNEVKTADCLPGGSEARTEQLKTVKAALITTSRPPLEFPLSKLVEKEPSAVLPASSSLAALDALLKALQMDGEDLLTLVPAPNCPNDDPSFSAISPIAMKTKRSDKRHETIYIPPKERNVDVKPLKSLLKPTLATLAKNEVPLPASSSLAALDEVLQVLQSEGDILKLTSGPNYPSVDFSFSAVAPSILPKAKYHYNREGIHMSSMKTSTIKPSQRL